MIADIAYERQTYESKTTCPFGGQGGTESVLSSRNSVPVSCAYVPWRDGVIGLERSAEVFHHIRSCHPRTTENDPCRPCVYAWSEFLRKRSRPPATIFVLSS